LSANFDKQTIIDFSVFSAAVLIPALAWAYIPFLSLVAMLIIPVSLAVLVRKQDLRYALVMLLIMVAVLSAFTSKPQLALLLVLQTGPLGLLLGLLFKNHVPAEKALTTIVLFSITVAVGIFLLTYLFTGNNPLVLNNDQRHVFDQERQLLIQMFAQGGMAGELDPETMNELERVIEQLEVIWPVLSTSSAIIWFMVVAAITYWLTKRVMSRLGYSVPASIPFSHWRIHWYAIWGIITGLGLLLVGDQVVVQNLAVVGKIILLVTGFIF